MPFFKKPNRNYDWLKGKWIFVADGFFGDNGKGKITNFLAYYLKKVLGLDVGLCVRPNGGANAGHEVQNPYGRGDREGSYVGNITPMAILQGVPAMIGPGAALDLEHFFETELPRLAAKGIDIEKIRVSRKTHLVLPHYKLIEELQEQIRGKSAIGTTKKAIGQTYEMRDNRFGITVKDVVSGGLKSLIIKINQNLEFSRHLLPPDTDIRNETEKIILTFRKYYARLKAAAVNEQELYGHIYGKGQVGIAEMGQGAGLDSIHGNYPFVTSSLTTIPGGLAQAGLSHKDLAYGILVVKGPYWTRVGAGDFPTEFPPDEAEKFRQIGHEFGTTTGRPRRCGYPDLPFLVKAIELNGPDCLCLTKIDTVPETDMLKINNAFGNPAKVRNWHTKDVFGKTQLTDLPATAQLLVHLYEQTGTNAELISTGPSLEDMIIRKKFLKKP